MSRSVMCRIAATGFEKRNYYGREHQYIIKPISTYIAVNVNAVLPYPYNLNGLSSKFSSTKHFTQSYSDSIAYRKFNEQGRKVPSMDCVNSVEKISLCIRSLRALYEFIVRSLRLHHDAELNATVKNIVRSSCCFSWCYSFTLQTSQMQWVLQLRAQITGWEFLLYLHNKDSQTTQT